MAPKDDDTPEKTEHFSVSRRDFLKSAGVTGLAATVAGVAEARSANRSSGDGPWRSAGPAVC